jgi:hypothetical protein
MTPLLGFSLFFLLLLAIGVILLLRSRAQFEAGA